MLLVLEEAVSTHYWAVPQNARQGSPSPEPGWESTEEVSQATQRTLDSIPVMPLTQTPVWSDPLQTPEGQESFPQASLRQHQLEQARKLEILRDLLDKKRIHTLLSIITFKLIYICKIIF